MLKINIAKNKKAVCAVSLFIIVVALVAVVNCQKCDYQKFARFWCQQISLVDFHNLSPLSSALLPFLDNRTANLSPTRKF